MQASQGIEGVTGDLDILAAAVARARLCAGFVCARCQVLGSKTYYPPFKLEESPGEVLAAFVPQYYLDGTRPVPGEIIVNAVPDVCRRWPRPFRAGRP